MDLRYKLNDRPPVGQLLLYSLQWFVLAVAVVITSLFIAVGSPAERVLYAQKVFALMGVATIVQSLWGHRLPIVVGPASVLLVGIITAMAAQGDALNVNKIYTALLLGGVAVVLLTIGRAIEYLQRVFTPRIVMVIMMLIAFTLAPTIKNLIFPAADAEHHAFGLWFTMLGVPAMVLASSKLKGVAKSLLVPASLLVGCVIYYVVYGGLDVEAAESAGARGAFFLPKFEFDGSMIVAFLFCYIALLINDISSIQSLGAMLNTDSLQSRCRRGVGFTGVFNILAGCLGIIGPVNYSMSPGVIASSGCASRYAIVPAGVALILCALFPDLIAVLSAIPDSVIGVILLYLMGTQLAASYSMLATSGSVKNFEEALIVGLPIMVALIFGIIPMSVIPAILRPILGNGFVMGVICVILLEYLILRQRKQ